MRDLTHPRRRRSRKVSQDDLSFLGVVGIVGVGSSVLFLLPRGRPGRLFWGAVVAEPRGSKFAALSTMPGRV